MTEKALSLGGLGIGLMQWGTTGIDNHVVNPKGNLPDKEVRNIWRICREHKIVFFDTAEGYGGGTSEMRVRDVTRWYQETVLQGVPDGNEVIIATKYLPTLWRWTKSAFYKSLRGSLDRLGVKKIDLYFIHTPIHPLPIECFIQWACDAVDDGLIQHIGISNCNADLCKRAHAVAEGNGKSIACNQIMLNLLVWQSAKHRETVQTCHELGISIAAYSPIGQGLLTDHLTPEKFETIRAAKMTGVKYLELYSLRQELEALSRKYNATMAQVSMNWVRAKNAVPLVGCRTVAQVNDAQQSMLFALSEDEVQQLDDLSLGLSLFERPLWRRCFFVVFISILQLAYYTEQRYVKLKKLWLGTSNKGSDHEE